MLGQRACAVLPVEGEYGLGQCGEERGEGGRHHVRIVPRGHRRPRAPEREGGEREREKRERRVSE